MDDPINDSIVSDVNEVNFVKMDRRKTHKLRFPKRAWAAYAVKDAKKRAETKGVPFDITRSYIESILPDECPVFGTKFTWIGNGKIRPESPALDRIKPSLGYIEGNVHVISVKANNIKSAYNSQDILTVARWLQNIEQNKG